MKQTSNSLLTTEERPGVVQRNTVSAISDNEGIGALGQFINQHLVKFISFRGLSVLSLVDRVLNRRTLTSLIFIPLIRKFRRRIGGPRR